MAGKAKVMSLDESEKAQAARAAKVQPTAGKKNRGQKPRYPEREAAEATARKMTHRRKCKPPASEAGTTASAKAQVAWISEAQDPANASMAKR